MNIRSKLLFGSLAALISIPALAQVTFYEGENFRGRAFTSEKQLSDFRRSGFNDRASSVVVERGTWEVCDDANFRGTCVVLREGSYDSLRRMGVNDRLSSARKVDSRNRSANYYMPDPAPYPDYEYRRRPNERVYEAKVTSVRAVMGRPEEHCWVDREQVVERGKPNVAGGIIGGVIGGILGHEIGGKGIATAGGAVAGAAVGANAGRSRDDYSQDVRRCETTMNGEPDYWDVRYDYRGTEHRVQMSAPPGRTIAVNRNGEPRQ